MAASDIGIDLGTRNCLVYSTGKGLVLKESTVVVYDKDTEKIKAIGEEARQMAGHANSGMEVIRPIRQGVIVDYVVMEKMLKYFISKAIGRRAFRKPRISICVPSGITEIERKAVEESTYQAGAREVFLVGGAHCRCHWSRGGCDKAFWKSDRGYRRRYNGRRGDLFGGSGSFRFLKVAGDVFDQAIMNYVRKNHSLFISEDAAEEIRLRSGLHVKRRIPELWK